MNKLTKYILATTAIIAMAGCRGVPNSYIGQYQDNSRRTTLELDTYEGTLQFADGRSITGKLEDLKFDTLNSGKTALYARGNSKNGDMVEIFLVQPNMSTRQTADTLTWFQAEIVYSMIDSKNDSAARNVTLVHCRAGTVLLDTATQRVQLGCPENPERIDLHKTRDGRPGNGWGPGEGGGP